MADASQMLRVLFGRDVDAGAMADAMKAKLKANAAKSFKPVTDFFGRDLPQLGREFKEDPWGAAKGLAIEMGRAQLGMGERTPNAPDQAAVDMEHIRTHPQEGAFAQLAMPIRDARISGAFTPQMRELLNDPPENLGDFVPMSEFQQRYRRQYVGEGSAGKNSRFDPSSETLPAGTWVVDDMNGIHGREIGYVTKVDPAPIQISEHLPERADDVARYAEWMRSGMEPPPVSALETDRGGLKIGDGHRRRLASIEAGKQLPAVVWPTGPHPKGLVEFGKTDPMRVGLTFEMLQAMRNASPGR